jgi:hypothetical protein
MQASLGYVPDTALFNVWAYVTLNFNKNMCTAAVFLNIEKAFHKAWHEGLLHKLSELKCSIV